MFYCICVDMHGKKYKGRKCATKASAQYHHMQADLCNLWAAQGSINAAHSNFREQYYLILKLDFAHAISSTTTKQNWLNLPIVQRAS